MGISTRTEVVKYAIPKIADIEMLEEDPVMNMEELEYQLNVENSKKFFDLVTMLLLPESSEDAAEIDSVKENYVVSYDEEGFPKVVINGWEYIGGAVSIYREHGENIKYVRTPCIFGNVFVKGRNIIYIVNESEYECVGSGLFSIIAKNKKSLETLMEDFSPVLSDKKIAKNYAVSQTL